jgi:hypothetical protein
VDRTVPQATEERLMPLIEARRATLRAIADISDDDLLRVGVTPDWSVRDLLAHLAAWDHEEVCCIDAWLHGAPPPPPHTDFDAFNAAAVTHARTLPLAATLIALMQTHEELLAAIARIGSRDGAYRDPEGKMKQAGLVAVEARGHEGEHTRQITAWRAIR